MLTFYKCFNSHTLCLGHKLLFFLCQNWSQNILEQNRNQDILALAKFPNIFYTFEGLTIFHSQIDIYNIQVKHKSNND